MSKTFTVDVNLLSEEIDISTGFLGIIVMSSKVMAIASFNPIQACELPGREYTANDR